LRSAEGEGHSKPYRVLLSPTVNLMNRCATRQKCTPYRGLRALKEE
jgi:hypothetical protein